MSAGLRLYYRYPCSTSMASMTAVDEVVVCVLGEEDEMPRHRTTVLIDGKAQ
jgi:hypothetical protein